jgi:hypothetical protein
VPVGVSPFPHPFFWHYNNNIIDEKSKLSLRGEKNMYIYNGYAITWPERITSENSQIEELGQYDPVSDKYMRLLSLLVI